jgi:hypothetical protein
MEVLSDIVMCLLGLVRCRDLACTDSPYRLVRNHNLTAEFREHRTLILFGGQDAHLQSASFVTCTTALSWVSTTCLHLPASRSSKVSPMQRITDNPASIAALVFCATSSEVSPKIVRRSEWPGPRDKTWVSAGGQIIFRYIAETYRG